LDIASLHIESWRSTYSAILSPEYFANDIERDLGQVWSGRRPDTDCTALGLVARRDVGLVAQRGAELVGFVYAIADYHSQWGTYIDNLHTRPGERGGGVGSQLLKALCEALLERDKPGSIFLCAFERNERTCRYYERIGGVMVLHEEEDLPDGTRGPAVTYAWRSVAALQAGLTGR
jgi:GNAT superfamily N-acetyltransferase